MTRYLLSVHSGDDGASRGPMTDEDRAQAWASIQALEADMKSSGA
jgi:hypothetical protein